MNEPVNTSTTASPAPSHAQLPVVIAPVQRRRWRWLIVALLLGLTLVGLGLSWKTGDRVRKLEQELVRRQQDSQSVSGEARMIAKRADESSRESAAKVSLLEARLAEVSVQRTQLDELIQSLSRSRDENLLVDIDAGLRVAQQQATITGSAEPLVTALKAADERLARYSQPRLDGVRRAIAKDIDRVRAVGMADISALSLKLDEAIRLIDELPMAAQPEGLKDSSKPPGTGVSATALGASAAQPAAGAASGAWLTRLSSLWTDVTQQVWKETRSLVRVTRVDAPDAALLAPDQAFFLRENLKLRLLNARLALLSRQFNTAQTDLQNSQAALERYFDRNSRRTAVAIDLLKQVAAGSRNVSLPRPEQTFAALATLNTGR